MSTDREITLEKENKNFSVNSACTKVSGVQLCPARHSLMGEGVAYFISNQMIF